ncbi:hypothetical protein [Allopontixanthobacter sp.]|uniref:hypothetical protein n=1 Tax=Allopontixanthobacter sp. TaxID=2906452 RepID=UPI002AB8CC6B|nr:hypothetical protein [Allopontixanthobacter sp.]MDZ4307061.1 hypothetical protein [Allopontixanthobacter sp.]
MITAETSGPIRIGFLYNHEELHQIAHTAPIISRLQAAAPHISVEVLTSSDNQTDAVMTHLDPQMKPPVIRAMAAGRLVKAAEKAIGGIVPLGRIGGLAANRDLLGSYDALVVPETTTTLLKTRFGMERPRLIFCPHGAGDRSISVSPDIAHFDYVLLPGEKTRERMLAGGVIREADHAVVGYPKFDAPHLAARMSFFDNDRPTVLYNPHFDPLLSSWHDFGLQVLDYFAGQDTYNLIFAPHVMLFQRRILASVEHRKIRFRQEIPSRYRALEHIRIDTGSDRSVDMSYTRNSDLYIGDVSSQIYEFLQHPRPAIFLNSHGARWHDDPSYAFWHFGQVIEGVNQLPEALQRAFPLGEELRSRQVAAFEQTFSIEPGRPSASRAAEAITAYLAREWPARFSQGADAAIKAQA